MNDIALHLATQIFSRKPTMAVIRRGLGTKQARAIQVPEASVKMLGQRLFTPGDIEVIEDAFIRPQTQQQ
jgi:hypothetical protein